jgi:hypothetical protein
LIDDDAGPTRCGGAVSLGSRASCGSLAPMPEEDDAPFVHLEPWTGPWPADDPDANFKADVALYSLTDPLETIRGLSQNLGVPIGALCRYVLAKWASGGSGGLLELGPTMARRLDELCQDAEAAGTDEARIAAYEQLRAIIGWLNLPLQDPGVYP